MDGTYDDDFDMLQVDGTREGEGEQEGGEENVAAEQQEGEGQEQIAGEAGEEAAGLEGLGDPEAQVGLPDGGDQLPLIGPTTGELAATVTEKEDIALECLTLQLANY